MATLPYFVLGPNTVISLIGLLRGPDKTVPTPVDDWREAKVDVVIPAHNEENTIILCIESLTKQTLKPNRIIVIDDGSTDQTSAFVKEFSSKNNIPVEIIRNEQSIGKTPGVKKCARTLQCDVQFVLDGDTVLTSENYIERIVQELYQGVGIACACGVVLPLRESDRRRVASADHVREFYANHPEASYILDKTAWRRFLRGITNIYLDFLYFFLQKFIYIGQMVFFGSIVNPIGCAVAYRREYIKDLFDYYEPILGDNLTNSEDIFIGFALAERGYRNIQVGDVYALSSEPVATSLPRQLSLWSSAFVQSCYYFPSLLFSPFKVFKRLARARKEKTSGIQDKRKILEAYRQAFGTDYTKKYGRPIGWTILFSMIEKIVFPFSLIFMFVFKMWEALEVTFCCEVAFLLVISIILARQYHRFDYVWKAIASTPVRYAALLLDIIVLMRFVSEVWIIKDHKWRK